MIIVNILCLIYVISQILIIVTNIVIIHRNNISDSIIKSSYAIVDHDDAWGIYPVYNIDTIHIENNNLMPSSEWKTNITTSNINNKNTFYQNNLL